MSNPPNEQRAVLAACIGSRWRRVQILPPAEAKERAIQLLNATVSEHCVTNLHPITPELHGDGAAFPRRIFANPTLLEIPTGCMVFSTGPIGYTGARLVKRSRALGSNPTRDS